MADGSHLENRYDVITLPQMIQFRWNLVCRWETTCRWQWQGQNRNQKYNFNMAAVCIEKPETV